MAIKLKEVSLGLLTALSGAAVFWWWSFALSEFLGSTARGEYRELILPLLALGVAAALFCVGTIFARSPWIVYPAALASIAIPFLSVRAEGAILGALAFSLILTAFAVEHIRKEYAHSLGFSLGRIARSGLPTYFTAASLVIAAFSLVYLSPEKSFTVLFPKSVIAVSLRALPAGGALNLPSIDPEATVDDFLSALVRERLKSQGIDLSSFSEKEIAEALADQRLALSRQYGVELSGREKVADVFYRSVTQYIRDLLGPYEYYLPFASALAFFLSFKTLTIPLYYLTLFLAFLLIKLMLWGKILKKEIQEMKVERITL